MEGPLEGLILRASFIRILDTDVIVMKRKAENTTDRLLDEGKQINTQYG